jgi:hypothetical protein
MYVLKGWTHLLMKHTEQAGKSLDEARQIIAEVKPVPVQLALFYRTQFEYHLLLLENSMMSGNKDEYSQHRQNALKLAKLLFKTCRKAPVYDMESHRLMGVYHWLMHDQQRAFKWWQKAIADGELLGAAPELARIYADMAVRARSATGESPVPACSDTLEHLQKAKRMFRELGLHKDLEDLDFALNRTIPSKSFPL